MDGQNRTLSSGAYVSKRTKKWVAVFLLPRKDSNLHSAISSLTSSRHYSTRARNLNFEVLRSWYIGLTRPSIGVFAIFIVQRRAKNNKSISKRNPNTRYPMQSVEGLSLMTLAQSVVEDEGQGERGSKIHCAGLLQLFLLRLAQSFWPSIFLSAMALNFIYCTGRFLVLNLRYLRMALDVLWPWAEIL